MTARRFVGLAALVLVVAVAGCSRNTTVNSSDGSKSSEAPKPLVALARPRIPDVPVPIGFKIDKGRSRTFEAAGLRYADHVYKGRADGLAVRDFYSRHMPINRWVLVTRMMVQGEITLDFEKETERCRVVIAKGSWFHRTNIKVQLWTSGRIVGPAVATANKR